MDENEPVAQEQVATPIFNVYRRGYDPEQVDRYVADQQRRLDDALHRASESERRLAAAVGQLRELHRRVAVYESETRTAQPPALDTLGERVQRILQEAWEGAYTLRQEAEREVNELREAITAEVNELREVASREAADIVDQATRRALAIRDETERRRHAYLQRIEQDRERAVSQITYLYDQRQEAIAELARLQTTVQAIVEEMARSPLGRPAPGVAVAAASPAARDGSPALPPEDDSGVRPGRHSSSGGTGPDVENGRDDVTIVGEPMTSREYQAAEELASRARWPEGRSGAEETEVDPGEAPRSGRGRNFLFDAEEQGWT
ncbi:MAG: hypothetical protein ABR972_12715 [Acidimicrobiales bacterium]|jgi:cell division septum initiation protein DivIVA